MLTTLFFFFSVKTIVGFSIFCTQSLLFNFSIAAGLQPRSLAHDLSPLPSLSLAGLALKLKDQFKQSLLNSVSWPHVTAASQCAEFRGITVTNINVDSRARVPNISLSCNVQNCLT